MVVDWLRMVCGILTIRIEGAEPERFFNVCGKKKIHLHRIRRCAIDRVEAEITVPDFYRLWRNYRRTRCRVHILRRRGLPFLWKRMRHRYGLGVGFLMMCVLCFELVTRIWVIQTDFALGIDGEAILHELKTMGIGIGTKSSIIEPSRIQVRMMNERKELKYFSINVNGNVISLQAYPRNPVPEVDQEQGVHQIIALEDGIIQRQIIRRGTGQYETGDIVTAGSVLVDSLVKTDSTLSEDCLVDANADIWAATRYHISAKIPLVSMKKQYTGKEKKKYSLCFGKRRINLYFSSSLAQEKCDRIISAKTVMLNEYFALPVTLLCETMRFYETKPITHKAEDYAARLEYGVRRSAEEMLNEGNVTSIQNDLSTEGDAALLRSVVWCYEQIGERVVDPRTTPIDSDDSAQSQESDQ